MQVRTHACSHTRSQKAKGSTVSTMECSSIFKVLIRRTRSTRPRKNTSARKAKGATKYLMILSTYREEIRPQILTIRRQIMVSCTQYQGFFSSNSFACGGGTGRLSLLQLGSLVSCLPEAGLCLTARGLGRTKQGKPQHDLPSTPVCSL